MKKKQQGMNDMDYFISRKSMCLKKKSISNEHVYVYLFIESLCYIFLFK